MDIEQMVLPEGLSGVKARIMDVECGVFVIIPEISGRHLFFVSWREEAQCFFPVLADGTVSRDGSEAGVGDFRMYTKVELFLASDIPRIRIRDDEIIWSDSG